MTQKENETCEEFVTALNVLVKDCAYTNPDEMIRERVVFGIHSAKIRQKLITTGSDLTLTKAIDIANLYELSRIQLKTMNEESKGNSAGNESEVNHIEAKHPHKDDSLNLKPVEIVVVENMNSVKSVQQLVKTVKDVERRIILNVCVNLCKQLRCKQLQQLQTEAR